MPGQKLRFPGFTAVYEESQDDAQEEARARRCPICSGRGMPARNEPQIRSSTSPSRRPGITEASLVKALEEKGIGRPSTYAPTISTIIARGYVARESKRLMPTELGKIVNDTMCSALPGHRGHRVHRRHGGQLDRWRPEIRMAQAHRRLLRPLRKDAGEGRSQSVEKVSIEDQISDICEKCGAMMVYKMSRYGKFLACPKFPELPQHHGAAHDIGVPSVPKCGAELLERVSRKGRKFYGCERYPECDFVSWDRPVKREVPALRQRAWCRSGGAKDTLFTCAPTRPAAIASRWRTREAG